MELVFKESTGYTQKAVKVLSLLTILDEFLRTRFIHYLTINIEGFEYKVLEELVGDGRFAKAGVTFCQIDAELHYPDFPKAHSEVRNINSVQFITHFLKNPSPYVPIFNAPYLSFPHQKVTFINIVHPECENAFKISKYFESP